MSATLNMLDLIFLVMTAIFTATAFFRGFIKELFSVLTWFLAFLLAYALAPYVAKLMAVYSSNMMINQIVARFIIFILSFVTLVFTTVTLRKDLQDKLSRPLDRSLGVLFGVIKTVIVFGLVYSAYLNIYSFASNRSLTDKKDINRVLPRWFRESKVSSIIKFSGNLMYPAVRAFIGGSFRNVNSAEIRSLGFEDKIDEIRKERKYKLQPRKDYELEEKSGGYDENLEDAGYKKKDIQKMNRLIEILDQ